MPELPIRIATIPELFPPAWSCPATGVPAGLTSTYYKTFAPRMGIAWSPGDSGKTSIRAGWGLFYNPMEQLVLEQFSAEPPFGGSNIINTPLFNTPYLQQDGTQKPNPFNGILDPPRGQPVDWALFRPHSALRTIPAASADPVFGPVQPEHPARADQGPGSAGRLCGIAGPSPAGQPRRELRQCRRPVLTCTTADSTAMTIYAAASSTPTARSSFHLAAPTVPPDGSAICLMAVITQVIPAGTTVGSERTSHWSACGRYSSPNCDPSTGTGCPQDGTPVFSSIFAEDTIANSTYNSLQASLEKRFSHGLQSQMAYTFSKSFDQASSFEGELNPLDPHGTYSLSQFDARHRLVLSYVLGVADSEVLRVSLARCSNGWDVSGIYTYQTGFPIRITSSADNELMYSAFFEYPGEPDQLAPFHRTDPKDHAAATGSIPTASPRMLPTTPSHRVLRAPHSNATTQPVWPDRKRQAHHLLRAAHQQHGFRAAQSTVRLSEDKHFEFRAEFFNLFNHTQFNNPDGNITDGSDFGRITRAKRSAPDSVCIEVLLLAVS